MGSHVEERYRAQSIDVVTESHAEGATFLKLATPTTETL